MTVYWEWNGTLEQIQNLTWPQGYVLSPKLFSLENDKLKLSAVKRPAGSGGEKAPTIVIDVRDSITEFYWDAIFEFDGAYSLLREDGKSGWATIFRPISYDIAGKVWCIGVQVNEDLNDSSKLKLQAWIMGKNGYTRAWQGFIPQKIDKGNPIFVSAYIKLGETDGICQVFVNGELLFNFQNICTDPRRILGNATPRVVWRNYIDNNLVSYPQVLYLNDMKVYSEIIPEPEPEPEPEPPAPSGCITAFLLTGMGLSTLLPYLRLFRSHLPRITVKTYYNTSDKIMGVINCLE